MIYHIFCPWKFEKNSLFKPSVDEYLKRISHTRDISLVCSPKSFSEMESSEAFVCQQIDKVPPPQRVILALDENGTAFSSDDFANYLQQAESDGIKNICFCLGGAYGFSSKLSAYKNLKLISLSKLTFPHELALLVLTEQIYRARTIIAKHPYHHGSPSQLSKIHTR